MFPMFKNGSVEPAPKVNRLVTEKEFNQLDRDILINSEASHTDFIDQGWSAEFFDDLRCDAFYLFDNKPLSLRFHSLRDSKS